MVEIIGTVELQHSNRLPGREIEKKCICCPGFDSHIFGISLALPEYPSGLDFWVQSKFSFKQLEGKRIRITAELVD